MMQGVVSDTFILSDYREVSEPHSNQTVMQK